jgi:flagellar FliL protein
MASDADDTRAGKGSLLMLLVQVGALTVLGAAGGGFVGTLIVAKVKAAVVAAAVPPEPIAKGALSEDVVVKELAPIVTNLAQPEGMKIRLQASILFNKKEVETPTLMSAQITDDLVGYLKTLSIAQLQGGSGLQSLREDLNERVAIRSEGHVRELIIETLVVQ